ncbi:MAG: FtsX-like permease family protein [Bacteroidales bacterium]
MIVFNVLLIYSFFIYKQVNFALNSDLGYDPENLVVVYLDLDYFSEYDVYLNSIVENSNIISISGASTAPPTEAASYSKFARVDDPSVEVTFESYLIDYNFFKTLNVNILEGRAFSREYPTDQTSSIIINQQAVDEFGIKKPIGKKIGDRRIIGVVDNFNVHSFRRKILPSIFTMDPTRIYSIILRVNPQNQKATIKFLESKMKEIAPSHPFTYKIIKPELRNFYKADLNFGNSITIYTLFTLLISTLGLLGLTLFLAKRRSKEITIRKVHGANTIDIIKFYLSEYLGIVIIANIIAWPLAYLFVDKWLQDFPIRISLMENFWLFLISGIISSVFVFGIVGIKAIHTSLTNPVENLKYE